MKEYLYLAESNSEVLGFGLNFDILVNKVKGKCPSLVSSDIGINYYRTELSKDKTIMLDGPGPDTFKEMEPYCGIFYYYNEEDDTDMWEILDRGVLLDVRY